MAESTGKTPGATKAYVDTQDAAEVTNRNSAIAAIKQTRAGHLTIAPGDISLGVVAKRVDFASPMPNSSYQVMPMPNGLAGVFAVSALDANGFTLNITSAVIGTVGYIAVQE